jgi:hypothetical protein
MGRKYTTGKRKQKPVATDGQLMEVRKYHHYVLKFGGEGVYLEE